MFIPFLVMGWWLQKWFFVQYFAKIKSYNLSCNPYGIIIAS